MLLSSMRNKVIINITTGEKIGYMRNSDLQIDETNGRIKEILMPKNKLIGLFSQEEDYYSIKWSQIVTIGADAILIDPKAGKAEL